MLKTISFFSYQYVAVQIYFVVYRFLQSNPIMFPQTLNGCPDTQGSYAQHCGVCIVRTNSGVCCAMVSFMFFAIAHYILDYVMIC